MNMESLIFPAILLGVMLIFLAVFLIVTKKQHKKASINSDNKKSDKGAKSSGSVKKSDSKDIPQEDIFKFMEFDRVLDNMIVQNDGTKFTMAIKCKGINYDLMSDMEQISVEEGFITFLNTLRFPIQLYVQAQNIDLKGAIATYKKNASGVRDEFESINKQYMELVDQFDAKREDIEVLEEKRSRVLNVYEYAADIINYVERLSVNKNLLQRNFYVLVSYYSSEITASSNFTKEELINICYNELLTRAQTIISGLSACSVTGTILTSNEIADLLYTAYNRDDKGLVSVKEAIESGFYRLYSTSEDVFYKKQEKLLEQINDEAELKALEAIKKAVEDGTYISPTAEKLNVAEQISKKASEIVKEEDLPKDLKEKANEILVDDYVINKNKILEEMVEEKRETEKKIGKKVFENTKEDNSVKDNNINTKEDDNGENNLSVNEDQLDNRMGFESDFGSGLRDVQTPSENGREEENSSSDEDDLII